MRLTVERPGERIELPPKEFNLLFKLLSTPGRAYTRMQLLDEVWGWDTESSVNTVNVHVNRLRTRFVTAEQRKYMYRQVRRFRDEKPIFTIDFWNDGDFVGGCVAGGRAYCHINANGDVEPCAFVHYSDANIREMSLLEAYRAPLFKAYREGQPFGDNL